MTRIVHFSDHHGALRKLPPASIYICTGDQLPNFPLAPFWDIVPSREKQLQNRWIEKINGNGKSFRHEFLGSPESPLICVKGNHDFVDIAPLFKDNNSITFEITKPTDTIEINGLKFGGCRGINYCGGTWDDELFQKEFEDVVNCIENDLDVLVTHSPVYGILDEYPKFRHLGSQALASYLNRRNLLEEFSPPKAWLHGHLHECLGMEYGGKTLFSNAAETVNVVDL